MCVERIDSGLNQHRRQLAERLDRPADEPMMTLG